MEIGLGPLTRRTFGTAFFKVSLNTGYPLKLARNFDGMLRPLEPFSPYLKHEL